MYELLWYLLIPILEGSVALKTSRAEYIPYKQDIMISAHMVYLLLQYFLIYFICDSRYFLNFQGIWSSLANFTHNLLEREILLSSRNHVGYTYRIRVKAQL